MKSRIALFCVVLFGLGSCEFAQKAKDSEKEMILETIYKAELDYHQAYSRYANDAVALGIQTPKSIQIYLVDDQIPKDLKAQINPNFSPKVSDSGFKVLLVESVGGKVAFWTIDNHKEIKKNDSEK